MVAITPQPKAYKTFAAWLSDLLENLSIKQVDIAEITGAKPQMVTKWLNKSKPNLVHLAALSTKYAVSLQDLRDLVDGIKAPSEKPSTINLSCKTEMGARVGRKWEELQNPARDQVLQLLETLLTMQRMLKHEKVKA